MAEDSGRALTWGVIGHAWATSSLERAAATGRVAQALLITGPDGIGKTTLARALGRRLLCTGPHPPCGKCAACIKIARNTSPDVRLIEGVPTGWKFDRDGNPPPRKNDRERRTLRIEQIRELQPWLNTAPFESKYKVVIIRRFEEANDEAANAFLKTLEEPPVHAYLILTAQDPSVLLPTIVSRCQRVPLRPLAMEQVEQELTDRRQVGREFARLLARLSSGRLGWAIRAASDPLLLEARAHALEQLDGLLAEGRAERLTRAEQLSKNGEGLAQVLELWQTWWRDVLLLQSGQPDRVTNVDRAQVMEAQARRLSPEQVHAALKATRAATRYLEQNANARLLMQVLALNLPH